MRSSNPSLGKDTFTDLEHVDGKTMSIQGTVQKTFTLLFLLWLTASYVWLQYYSGKDIQILMWIGVIGGISAMYESLFEGITTQVVLLTLGVLFILLLTFPSIRNYLLVALVLAYGLNIQKLKKVQG